MTQVPGSARMSLMSPRSEAQLKGCGPHTPGPSEPQSLNCHPEAWASSSLCHPGAVGSSKLQIVPCPASCVGQSSLLAPRSGEGRELPRIIYAGDRPGSLHTPSGGCLLPGPQGPCSPNPGLGVCPTAWPQYTQPSRLVEDMASSWSHGHSAVPDQSGWAPSRRSHGKLDSTAGPRCCRTPRLGGTGASS